MKYLINDCLVNRQINRNLRGLGIKCIKDRSLWLSMLKNKCAKWYVLGVVE